MLSRPRPVIAMTAGRRRNRVWVLVMCRYHVRRCMIAAAAYGRATTNLYQKTRRRNVANLDRLALSVRDHFIRQDLRKG